MIGFAFAKAALVRVAIAVGVVGLMIAVSPGRAAPSDLSPPGPHVIATIPLDRQPYNVATNPLNGMVYVTEPFKLIVVNGRTNTVAASLPVPDRVFNVATEPLTDTIYVTDPSHRSVLAINGRTNQFTGHISVGGGAFWMATDPLTDMLYAQTIVNSRDGQLVVVNGRTNRVVARISDGNSAQAVAVNPLTSRIYVVQGTPESLLVIDGRTNKVIATVPDLGYTDAVDPLTNTIYVTTLAEEGPGSVAVIDGRTDAVKRYITVDDPDGIDVGPLDHMVYVANYDRNDVVVIDGVTDRVVARVPVGRFPRRVAVDPLTNTAYVTNTGSRSVSVITGAS